MFSIKSSVQLRPDHLISSFTYGGEYIHYYKVGEKWVLTKSTFDESEREEILNAIIDGTIKGFTIEDAA